MANGLQYRFGIIDDAYESKNNNWMENGAAVAEEEDKEGGNFMAWAPINIHNL